jgi:simple sugar transport system substrate-binding protein/ribose transport system substrate-binding protein
MAWGVALAALLLLGWPGGASATSLGVVSFQLADVAAERISRSIEASARDKGWDVTVADARGSNADLASLILKTLGSGANALILIKAPLSALGGPLEEAAAKKVPVISVMSGASPSVLLDVAVNEYVTGAQIATELLGLMGYTGSLAMVREPNRPVTAIRAKVMDLVLSGTPAVRLLGSYDMASERRSPDELKSRLSALLAADAPKPQAVWAATDDAAFAADDALRAMGYKKGQVLLTGIGGSQEAFRRIRDPGSLMIATVVIPYELLGETAADAMEDTLAKVPKDQITTGPFLFVDTVVVDKMNVPAEGEWPW